MALIQSKQTSTYEDPRPAVSVEDPAIEKERRSPADGHVEDILTANDNLEYDLDDEEPELHARTWIALAAMFLLNMVQIVALQGPPAVVSDNGLIQVDAADGVAILYRSGLEQHDILYVGLDFTYIGTGSHLSHDFIRLGHLPSP